jgi:hypothetical protein
MEALMNASVSRQHVLLVGIDAYQKVDPLHGCVNDVDAIEGIFLDRLHVDPGSITKLVAPHNVSLRTQRINEDKPTSANIRKALEALGTEVVRPGDRVFIHYSGHGTQVFSRTTRAAREALVPVDARAGGELLFDDEINALLHGIAARTNDLTVVLDGCCSAGATREIVPEDRFVRYCHFEGGRSDFTGATFRGGEVSRGFWGALDPSDPGFLVVASAQSGQAAHEGRDARGVRHGAFTAALLDLLARETADNIQALRWVDVWQSLRARVTAAFPGQDPCLIGRDERRVFGGPFEPRDPGFPITERNGTYEIRAGSLVGLSAGARVAVYGSEPPFFPPLHSAPDLAARRGILRVERVTLHSAVATLEGPTFSLEKDSRGRLVQPGPDEKLVVGMDPFHADLAQYLEREAPVVVVPLAERGARVLEAVIGAFPDGWWWLGDHIFGPEAPLASVSKWDWPALSQALWHYAWYNLPLRLVRRCRDLEGMLRLRVLDARHVAKIDREELHDPALPEIDPDEEGRYRYRLIDGHPVCFSVENRSSRPLYAHIINCASSGKVEVLGPTQLEVPPKRRQTFWLGGQLGRPFPSRISQGRVFNVDRLVAVGTTSPAVDLRYLGLRQSFADAMVGRSRDVSARGESHDAWTATMATVKIAREF